MPGFLSIYAQVERVELPDSVCTEPGFWIDLKVSLTTKDDADAQRALMRPRMRSVDGVSSTESDMDYGAFSKIRVLRSIVAWNLTDENERPLPVDESSIALLPQKVFAFIASRVNELNNPRTPQEESSFRNGTHEEPRERENNESDPS